VDADSGADVSEAVNISEALVSIPKDRVIKKECWDYKNLSLNNIKHIEMIQVLKCR
jgi:hypothetical protein